MNEINNPAASNKAWNLKRCKQRGIDSRGIRQLSVQARPLGSLLAEIKGQGTLPALTWLSFMRCLFHKSKELENTEDNTDKTIQLHETAGDGKNQANDGNLGENADQYAYYSANYYKDQ